MRNVFLLTKILLKTGTSPFSIGSGNQQEKKKAVRSNTVAYIVLAVCEIPIMALMVLFGMVLQQGLSAAGQPELAGLLAALVMVVIGLFFSLPYVLSTLFFSNDNDFFLPLPVSSLELAGARFLSILVFEYVTALMAGLPLLVGMGIAGGTPVFWLSAPFVLLLTPITPTVYGSLLGFLLLRLLRRVRNKENIMTVLSLLLLFVIMAVSMLTGYSAGSGMVDESEALVQAISQQSTTLFRIATLFPATLPAGYALAGNLLMLPLFLGANALLVAVYLFFARRLYTRDIATLHETGASRKALSAAETRRALANRGIFHSLLSMEWKTLLRTPAYLLNCVATVFIIPPILLLSLLMPLLSEAPELLDTLPLLALTLEPEWIVALVLAIALGFTAFVCPMNLTAGTAISREGKNLSVLKAMPVPIALRIRAKLVSAVLLSAVAILPYLLLFCVAAALLLENLWYALLFFPAALVSLLLIFFSSCVQLLGDLWKPKLSWESEQEAVKQNAMAAVLMLLSMLFFILLTGLNVVFYMLGVPLPVLIVLYILVMGGADVGLHMAVHRYGETVLQRL